jgi:hypothetical protein
MSYRFAFAMMTVLLAASPRVPAHHSFAPHYDRERPVRIEGTITGFEYTNPHSFVHIEVTDSDDAKVTRWCEMQAASQLRIKGVSRETLRVGDRIRVEGFQARRDPLGCEFATGYLADGSVLELRTSAGQSVFSAPLDADPSGSIFGTWFRKAFPGAGVDPDPSPYYTSAGAAAAAAIDVLTSNPVYFCSPVSPVRAWAQPGLPTEIRSDDDRVIIHHEFMDTVRTIHLDLTEHPADAQRSDIGHSIGRFEGDDLIVETALFSPGVLLVDFARTPDLRLTERFHVNPENGDLEITWTASDPAYLTEPIEGSRLLIRTTLDLGTYGCKPGVGHGDQMGLGIR